MAAANATQNREDTLLDIALGEAKFTPTYATAQNGSTYLKNGSVTLGAEKESDVSGAAITFDADKTGDLPRLQKLYPNAKILMNKDGSFTMNLNQKEAQEYQRSCNKAARMLAGLEPEKEGLFLSEQQKAEKLKKLQAEISPAQSRQLQADRQKDAARQAKMSQAEAKAALNRIRDDLARENKKQAEQAFLLMRQAYVKSEGDMKSNRFRDDHGKVLADARKQQQERSPSSRAAKEPTMADKISKNFMDYHTMNGKAPERFEQVWTVGMGTPSQNQMKDYTPPGLEEMAQGGAGKFAGAEKGAKYGTIDVSPVKPPPVIPMARPAAGLGK